MSGFIRGEAVRLVHYRRKSRRHQVGVTLDKLAQGNTSILNEISRYTLKRCNRMLDGASYFSFGHPRKVLQSLHKLFVSCPASRPIQGLKRAIHSMVQSRSTSGVELALL